jgi:hypothetical protein
MTARDKEVTPAIYHDCYCPLLMSLYENDMMPFLIRSLNMLYQRYYLNIYKDIT